MNLVLREAGGRRGNPWLAVTALWLLTAACNADGTASAPDAATPAGAIACRTAGDGKTTVVFVNRCSSTVSYAGSDITGGSLAPGSHQCVDIGSAAETLASKRYWGWVGTDPGPERHTLAEFTFNTDFHDFDWYDISHVDAFNLPMQIVPVGHADCPTLTCAADFLAACPSVGQYRDSTGKVVACVSPSRDDAQSPVVRYFEGCDDAYAWSGDDANGTDPSPMRACAGEDWDIVFCPAGNGQPADSGTADAGKTADAAKKGDAPSADAPRTSQNGSSDGSSDGSGDGGAAGALGAFPFAASTLTRGGTMTFTNVGAPGWWPRRLDRQTGDPACDYKDGTDTWGGHCCQGRHASQSTTLAPFDEEMTLIVKAIDIKQLAVYQPETATSGAAWRRVSAWDSRSKRADNLWFTQGGAGSATFPGDLTHDDCVGYLMQAPTFACGDGRDYYCPNDPGILHRGWSGSKLVVFLGSTSFDDAGVAACSGGGAGHPGPWVAFVASELVRDGGRKWNGLCNCYSKTGTVGDGCGEINLFEVVMDDNDYSNREFASTGLRSYQAGSVGGSVCKSSCRRDAFADEVDIVDACAGTAYSKGPQIAAGGSADGCPVWRRPDGDRFFVVVLDEATRTIQVAVVHPGNLPGAASALLPTLPDSLARASVQALLDLRLPN
jgi:hypothetical protein